MYVCVRPVWMCHAHSADGVSDALEVEVSMGLAAVWMLGTELWSSAA